VRAASRHLKDLLSALIRHDDNPKPQILALVQSCAGGTRRLSLKQAIAIRIFAGALENRLPFARMRRSHRRPLHRRASTNNKWS
jgi:hypothetical protein